MQDFSGMHALIVEMNDHGLEMLLRKQGLTVSRAACAAEAQQMLFRRITDFVFADVLLPGMDGIRFLTEISAEKTSEIRPGCVLTCVSGFPMPETMFPLLTRPYAEADVSPVLNALLPENRTEDAACMRSAEALLDLLGVPDHIGRTLLRDAVLASWNDARLSSRLSARIYPMLSARYGLTAAQAERAIRHVIDRTWQQGALEAQYRLFGNTIDAQRGKPTAGAMIARCADILRLEVPI